MLELGARLFMAKDAVACSDQFGFCGAESGHLLKLATVMQDAVGDWFFASPKSMSIDIILALFGNWLAIRTPGDLIGCPWNQGLVSIHAWNADVSL